MGTSLHHLPISCNICSLSLVPILHCVSRLNNVKVNWHKPNYEPCFSVQPHSWGLLIEKCCILYMEIVIFVLQLGYHFFIHAVFFFHIILIQIKRDHFQFFTSRLNCYHRFRQCSKNGVNMKEIIKFVARMGDP